MGSAGRGCTPASRACGTDVTNADGTFVEPAHSRLGRPQGFRPSVPSSVLNRLGRTGCRRGRAASDRRAVMGDRSASAVEGDLAKLE
jgi:hypothetical protein